MNMIIASIIVLAVIGLLIGILLVTAGEKFKVYVDPRETQVREYLPGANCGACGFAGCDALAAAIVKGEAPAGACTSCGAEAVEAIARIMGVSAETGPKNVAYVKCSGSCGIVHVKSNYVGTKTCEHAALNPGKSGNACQYGCFGFGSCTKVCPFEAIKVVNGLARVDRTKCVACGKCVETCPQKLIEIIPDKAVYGVQCANKKRGAEVKKECELGCIGCSACTKVCPEKAIEMINNTAHINQDKCVGCGKCAEKCPRNIIVKR